MGVSVQIRQNRSIFFGSRFAQNKRTFWQGARHGIVIALAGYLARRQPWKAGNGSASGISRDTDQTPGRVLFDLAHVDGVGAGGIQVIQR